KSAKKVEVLKAAKVAEPPKPAKKPEPVKAEAKKPEKKPEPAKAAPPAKPAKKPEPVKAEPAPVKSAKKKSGGAGKLTPPPGVTVGPDEELRQCEWERCQKVFVVKAGGRTAVRRFCSGTCRGRASEARTGKR